MTLTPNGALCDVSNASWNSVSSINVRRGEVYALAGANGAGKSTLMNIVSGVLTPDSGPSFGTVLRAWTWGVWLVRFGFSQC